MNTSHALKQNRPSTSLLLGLLTLLLGGCSSFQAIVLNDKEQYRSKGLKSTEAVITQPGFPYNNSMAFFIPAPAFQQPLKALIGARITSDKKLKEWGLRIDSLSATPANGTFSAGLQVSLFDPKDRTRLSLAIAARLDISGMRRTDSSLMLQYHLMPMAIEPNSRLFVLDLHRARYKKAIANLAAMLQHHQDLLAFEIPIKDALEVNLGELLGDTTKRVMIDEQKNWYIDLKASLAGTTLRKYLHLNAPAFLKQGIWLSFSLRDTPMVIPASAAEPNLQPGQLNTYNQQTDQQITQQVNAHGLAKPYAYFWLNSELITRSLAGINQLPAQNRTLHINSQKVNGYLSQSQLTIPLLGKGEFSGRFTGNQALKTAILVERLQSTWDPQKGLDLALGLSVAVKADVKVHIDPVIGGGVGTSIGIKGSLAETLKANIKFQIDTLQGFPVLLARPSIPCTTLSITAMTDDKAKMDFGWTRIPSFGVTLPFAVENSRLSAVSLLRSAPTTVDLGAPKHLSAGLDSLTFSLPYRYLSYATVPKTFSLTAQGIEAQIELQVSMNNDPTTIGSSLDKDRQLQAAIAQLRNKPLDCQKESLRVHAGQLEFGPNNTIIKFLGDTWNDLLNGPGDKNELVKAIDAVGDQINDTTPADDITYTFIKNVSDLAEKNLGPNNEISKVLKSTENEIDKLRKTPGKAIGDIPKNVIKEGGSAIKKVIKKFKPIKIKW